VSLLLWGVLLISVSVFIGMFKALEEYKIKNKIYKIIVLLIFLVGIFLFYKSLELKFFTTSASPPAAKAIEQKISES
jgi:Na+/H+ antiporter NhaB